MAEFLQLLQSLLTPALLWWDATTGTPPRLGPILCFPSLPLLVHMDGEGPAVELQHSLLENSGGREQQQGPNDGESPFMEALSPRATEPTTALILPRSQPLQAIWKTF